MAPADRGETETDGNPRVSVDAELKAVRGRELELKRLRGEISCAECRRVKLKCDKKVPCTSCKRRGCENICPIGTTVAPPSAETSTAPPPFAGVGTLAAARAKLHAMSLRIRSLEDALQAECSSRPLTTASAVDTNAVRLMGDNAEKTHFHPIIAQSVAPLHPLLAPELLRVKNDIDALVNTEEGGNEDEDADISRAFGTLSVRDGSTLQFLGPSASDQVLVETFDNEELGEAHAIIEDAHLESSASLSPKIAQASALWPFAPSYLTTPDLAALLVQHLPPLERATALVEAYFTNLSWFCEPLRRKQAVSELFPLFYPRLRRPLNQSSNNTPVYSIATDRPHDLALLFSLFALGAVSDLTLPENNAEALRYNTLARAALGLRNVFNGGSFVACQTICMLAVFHLYNGKPTSQENGWIMMSLGMSLANSIGLHRDPAGWNFDPTAADRRRSLFWEIYLMDLWNSLQTGRPCLFKPDSFDTKLPDDTAMQTVENDGTIVSSVWNWRYRFARDVLAHVSATLCSARPLKYSEILELDRRVRDFETHPWLLRPEPVDKLGMDPEFHQLHPITTATAKEWALLVIHRNFFAIAMLKYPDDPLRSPFAASVLSAYRSATSLLKLSRYSYDKMALILSRLWTHWARTFSCAVILAAVSRKGKAISFSGAAFHELELAIAHFEKASDTPAVQHGLPLLYRLRDEAFAVLYGRPTSRQPSSSPRNYRDESFGYVPKDAMAPRSLEDRRQVMEEELRLLGGATRLVECNSSPIRDLDQTMAINNPSPVHYSASPPSCTDGSSPQMSFQSSGTDSEDASKSAHARSDRSASHQKVNSANIYSYDSATSSTSLGQQDSANFLPKKFESRTLGTDSVPSSSLDAPDSRSNTLRGQVDPSDSDAAHIQQRSSHADHPNEGFSTANAQYTHEDLWSWLTSPSSFDSIQGSGSDTQQTHASYSNLGDTQLKLASPFTGRSSAFDLQTPLASYDVDWTSAESQTVPFSPHVDNNSIPSSLTTAHRSTEISRSNEVAWDTFLQQHGLTNDNTGMDWESFDT